MTRAAALWVIGLALTVTACRQEIPESVAAREAAYRENNRGVAALEQYAYEEAAARFRAAIALDDRVDLPHLNLPIALYYVADLDAAAAAAATAVRRVPASPHAFFVQGLIARGRQELAAATAAFARVLALDPEDVGALVNLAQIDLQEQRLEAAIARFRAAVAREPFNATATYGLGQALIRSGATDEGAEVMRGFEELRATAAAITYTQTYLAQGRYAEAMVSTGLEPDLIDRAAPRVRFTDQTTSWGLAAPATEAGTGGTAILLSDFDGDQTIDLAIAGAGGLRVLRGTRTRFEERLVVATASRTLGSVAGLTAADLDNDTRPDILVLHERGLSVHRQTPNGSFAAPEPTALLGRPRTAALLDVDHDGDLDVLAGGDRAGPAPGLTLLQNDGQAVFSDVTAPAGLASTGLVGALAATDFDGDRDIDVFALVEDGAPALFANERDGTFREVRSETGLASVAAGVALAAGDFNKDGRSDFAVLHAAAPASIVLSRGRHEFVVRAGPETTAGLTAVQAADYDNDGLLDLLAVGPRGLHVFRNVGAEFVDVTADALGTDHEIAAGFASLAVADLDADGDLDVATVTGRGALHLRRNDGGSANRSIAVTLRGLVSNRSGVGAIVDVRAGSLWQRLEQHAVTPAVAPSQPFIGLGGRESVDVARVLWPAGIVQAETPTAQDGASPLQIRVTELDRKPSSCPYLYTWNGERFAFVSDFLGGGELGYRTGAAGWNIPDSDEYVRITNGQLTARDGRLEVRVANELEEVLYLDHLRLLSVDHPSDVEVYPREGMRANAARGLSLAAVRNVRPLRRVVSDRGEDLSDRVARRDGISAQAFSERTLRGYADPHALVLTLPPPSVGVNSRALLLTGWTDYAFSSDNVAAAQRGWTLVPPRLEQRTRAGAWRPLVADVGIPVGRPQTIVIDLEPDEGAHTLRLSTNMRIHWDAMAIADLVTDAKLVTREHQRIRARLTWRGYSVERMHGAARVPDYAEVSMASPWKVFPGRYTREGNVDWLLAAPDDLFVVARTGDEMAMGFLDLPLTSEAMARTYLLHAVGFSKEMDLNSSSPDHVLPLPYRGITTYPPSPPPLELRARQQEAMDRYNTRVVTRPLASVPLLR